MRWLCLTLLFCLPALAQDDALRQALRERDQEIQRLQRLLADKDIELAQLRRTFDDIRRLLELSPLANAPTSEPERSTPGASEPVPATEPLVEPEPVPAAENPLPNAATDIEPWLGDLDAKGELTRERAIEALAQEGDAVLPHLEPLVTRGGLNARRSAVLLLGKIGSPLGVPLLEQAMHDQDVKVRLYAVNALAKIESQSSSLVLIESLDDTDPGVQMTASVVLSRRHGQDFDDDIDAWRAWAQANGMH